jgi:hypothetical protein
MRERRHRLVGFVTLLVARRIIRRTIRKRTDRRSRRHNQRVPACWR